jgi:GDPmannose 4,6-dehydratase
MMKVLVFGIGGQDGSYIAESHLSRGHSVIGVCRRSSFDNRSRIPRCERVHVVEGDITDPLFVSGLVRNVQPCIVYNEADQDNVRSSHASPLYQAEVTYKGALNIFEAVAQIAPGARVFQPLSATMFEPGDRQDLNTRIEPRSPYAMTKAAVYQAIQYYRKERGLYVYGAVMYNHDSPRRSESGGYLLQRMCQGAVQYLRGEVEHVEYYDPEHVVDIGHAKDYMEAAYSLIERQWCAPCDCIFRSHNQQTVSEVLQSVTDCLGHEIEFREVIGVQHPPMLSQDNRLEELADVRIDTPLKTIIEEILRKFQCS